jgi:hypothetical protein
VSISGERYRKPKLSRAEVHPRRWPTAFIGAVTAAVLGLVLGGLSFGHVLGRIDRAQATADAARAETRLLRSQMDAAFAHRDLKPDNVIGTQARAELELCRVRTQHLRSTIEVMVLAGTNWKGFVKLPSGEAAQWPDWPTPGWDLAKEPMRIVGGEPR